MASRFVLMANAKNGQKFVNNLQRFSLFNCCQLLVAATVFNICCCISFLLLFSAFSANIISGLIASDFPDTPADCVHCRAGTQFSDKIAKIQFVLRQSMRLHGKKWGGRKLCIDCIENINIYIIYILSRKPEGNAKDI